MDNRVKLNLHKGKKELRIEISLTIKGGRHVVSVFDADEGVFTDLSQEDREKFETKIKQFDGDVAFFKTTLQNMNRVRDEENRKRGSGGSVAVASATAGTKSKKGPKPTSIGTHDAALERKKAEIEQSKLAAKAKEAKKLAAKTQKVASKVSAKSKAKPKPKPRPVGRPRKSQPTEDDDDDDDDDEDEDEDEDKNEDEDDDDDDDEDPTAAAGIDLIGPMSVATRAPSKNARGHDRVLGKSKRSSTYGDPVGGKAKARGKGSKADSKNLGEKPAGAALVPLLQGAEDLFRAQRTGSRGLKAANRKHAQRAGLFPSREQLQEYRRKLSSRDPLFGNREELAASHLEAWGDWLWYLQLNFNLLFFGVGCKRELVESFVADRLGGEDVLSIDGKIHYGLGVGGVVGGGGGGGGGAGGSRTVRALLDAICVTILRQPASASAHLSLDSYVLGVVAALDTHYGRESSLVAGVGCGFLGGPGVSGKTTGSEKTHQQYPPPPPLKAPPNPSSSSFSWSGLYDNADAFSHVPNSSSQTGAHSSSGFLGLAQGARLVRSSSHSLEVAMSSSVGEADPAWGGRYVHAQAKLYVLVHSIDGECLQSPESQRVLARLAECSSVSLLATFDKVNTPLLWGNEELSRFRWVFVHVPTYEDYEIQPDFALFAGTKGTVGQGHALEYILSSLTNDHRQLVGILAADALQRVAARSAAAAAAAAGAGGGGQPREPARGSNGIQFDELLQTTARKLIAPNKERLSVLLKELEDHRLLTVTGDGRRGQIVVMQLSVDQLVKIKDAGWQ